jgi:hypothetical protein
MRMLVFCAAVLLAPLALPATPAVACITPSVPVYPGPEAADGFSLPAGAGTAFISLTAPLVDVQAFYYARLPDDGWAIATSLAGQHPEQREMGSPSAREPSFPQGALEFTRNDGREHVRIVGAADGYRIYLACRD